MERRRPRVVPQLIEPFAGAPVAIVLGAHPTVSVDDVRLSVTVVVARRDEDATAERGIVGKDEA
jgi:hypothetical protein